MSTSICIFLGVTAELKNEIRYLKKGTSEMFKVVFERLNNLEDAPPPPKPNCKKIGLKN
jgi:hypothetical protein